MHLSLVWYLVLTSPKVAKALVNLMKKIKVAIKKPSNQMAFKNLIVTIDSLFH